MINLLPPETKESFRYARLNMILLRWLAGITLGIIGIVIITSSGMVFLNQTITSASSSVNETQTLLKVDKLNDVKQQIRKISSNLKLMVAVLSREVLYSKLLKQIGAALPHGAVLTGINITQVQGGINLQAATIDYHTATQIQINLQDPNNKIFSKADIVSIQCQSKSQIADSFTRTYPCKAQYRVQFVSKNPFLFINNTTGIKGKT